MSRNYGREIDRIDCRYAVRVAMIRSFKDRSTFARAQDQLRRYLSADATRKIGAGSIVEWDGDDSGKRASEKCRYPLGTVRSPQHHSTALVDFAGLQFARELMRNFCHATVAPPLQPIASRKHIGGARAQALKIVERVQQSRPHTLTTPS